MPTEFEEKLRARAEAEEKEPAQEPKAETSPDNGKGERAIDIGNSKEMAQRLLGAAASIAEIGTNYEEGRVGEREALTVLLKAQRILILTIAGNFFKMAEAESNAVRNAVMRGMQLPKMVRH